MGVRRFGQRQALGHDRVNPAFAEHLRRYVRTGTVCTYVVPDEPVRWTFCTAVTE